MMESGVGEGQPLMERNSNTVLGTRLGVVVVVRMQKLSHHHCFPKAVVGDTRVF